MRAPSARRSLHILDVSDTTNGRKALPVSQEASRTAQPLSSAGRVDSKWTQPVTETLSLLSVTQRSSQESKESSDSGLRTKWTCPVLDPELDIGRRPPPLPPPDESYTDIRSLELQYRSQTEVAVREHFETLAISQRSGVPRSDALRIPSPMTGYEELARQEREVHAMIKTRAAERMREHQLEQEANTKRTYELQQKHLADQAEEERKRAEEERQKQKVKTERMEKEKQERELRERLVEDEKRRKEVEEAAQKPPSAPATTARTPSQPQPQLQPQAQPPRPIPTSAPAAPTPSGPVEPKAKKSAVALSLAEKRKKILAEVEAAIQTIPPEMRAAKMDFKKKINVAVSQISGTRKQVMRKSEQLIDVLRNAERMGQAMSAFCMDTLAERIVDQADAQISAAQASAFPIAAVAVNVCAAHPALTDVLMAHFHRLCPYTVPMYPPKQENQSMADYQISIGYRHSSEGPNGFETEDSYLARISGTIALYAAITQTIYDKGVHPFGLSHAWAWLARVLNMRPRRVTPTILLPFLEIAGYELNRVYRRQFVKLLNFISKDYMTRLPPDAPAPAVARLKIYMHEFRAAGGKLQAPEGRNMPEDLQQDEEHY